MILPLPKLNEDQSGYSTFPGTEYSVVMIPKVARMPECSGAVLEALCSRSMRDVLPAYYDLVTEGRYSQNDDVRAMFELAVSRRYSDSAWIYAEHFNNAVKGIFGIQLESGELSNFAGYSVCINAIARSLPELNSLFK